LCCDNIADWVCFLKVFLSNPSLNLPYFQWWNWNPNHWIQMNFFIQIPTGPLWYHS
jgi:hypothetical protein